MTPEAGQGSRVEFYENADGLRKISAALQKFEDWDFKSMNEKLAAITKQIADIKGIRSKAGTDSHIKITFNRNEDGANSCLILISNGIEVTEEWPPYKAIITKAWIDNLIKEATDPERLANEKKADDELK